MFQLMLMSMPMQGGRQDNAMGIQSKIYRNPTGQTDSVFKRIKIWKNICLSAIQRPEAYRESDIEMVEVKILEKTTK